MNFFLDNNLSPHLASALDALSSPYGHAVVHLRDKFRGSVSDAEWIKSLHDEGDWVVVTQDRLTKHAPEREALQRTSLIVFILKKQWASLAYWDKAWQLVRWWPRIIEQAEGVTAGGFVVPIRLSGKGKFEAVKL